MKPTPDETPPPRPPAPCHVCGHLRSLVDAVIRNRTFKLCDDCAVKLVSDLQRELIPAMR